MKQVWRVQNEVRLLEEQRLGMVELMVAEYERTLGPAVDIDHEMAEIPAEGSNLALQAAR